MRKSDNLFMVFTEEFQVRFGGKCEYLFNGNVIISLTRVASTSIGKQMCLNLLENAA